jgi:hypothetical protein
MRPLAPFRLRRGKHLRGGRSDFAGAALHVGNVGAHLRGAALVVQKLEDNGNSRRQQNLPTSGWQLREGYRRCWLWWRRWLLRMNDRIGEPIGEIGGRAAFTVRR